MREQCTQVVNFKACPSCGAKAMEYVISSDTIRCNYCGTQEQIKDYGIIYEYAYEAFTQHEESSLIHAYYHLIKCPLCGAINSFKPFDVADFCNYCGTHLNWQIPSKNPIFQPQAIYPFRIPRELVLDLVKGWLKEKVKTWYVPSNLHTLIQPEVVEGIYVPFWTIDISASSHFYAKRGDYQQCHTYILGRNKLVRKHYVKKIIKWQSIQGNVDLHFDDILVLASNYLPLNRLDKLLVCGYNADHLKPYNPKYLLGFRVERYNIPLQSAYKTTEKLAHLIIRRQIKDIVGGDRQKIRYIKTDYRQITFKHILLPLWIVRYCYFGKCYHVAVSGITGNIVGSFPIDMRAIVLVSVILSIITFIIILLIY